MSKEEIKHLIQNNKHSKGVVAEGSDGRLYYLAAGEAKKAEFQLNAEQKKIREEVLKKISGHGRGNAGGATPMEYDFCDDVMDDLTSHKPNYGEWYTMAKWFLENC